MVFFSAFCIFLSQNCLIVSPMILATNHDIGPAILCGNGLTLLLDGSVTVLQSTPIGFLQRAHRLKSGLMPPQFLHTA
jgi:hypothetical protein